VRQAWAQVDPDPFVDGVHIEAICAHLEAVDRGEIRNLVINVPPRHSKSTICGVLWPAWRWIDHPQTRWLCASYAHNLSIRDSVKMRRLLLSPWYQERWGDRFRLMADQNAKIRFDNDRGGYRIATSVTGQVTGEGGDRLLVDDPHNVLSVESEVRRQEVLDWWDGAMSTRGNDPKTVARVIIAQRVHENDLCGHVLAREGYEHLCLPAEYEPDHPFRRVTAIGWEDPRRGEGELLCPERFGPREMEALKAALASPLRVAGQLQQRPAPRQGAIFKAEWFLGTPAVPAVAERVRAWDKAATLDGDWTAGVLMSRTREGIFTIEDVVRVRATPDGVNRILRATAEKDGPAVRIWGEQEPGAAGVADRDAFRRLLAGFSVHTERPTGDKVLRAEPLAAQFEAGNVRILATDASGQPTPWRAEFEAQLLTFPAGKYDDMVDAAALAFNKLAGKIEGAFL